MKINITIACINASSVASGNSVFPPIVASLTACLNSSAVKFDKVF